MTLFAAGGTEGDGIIAATTGGQIAIGPVFAGERGALDDETVTTVLVGGFPGRYEVTKNGDQSRWRVTVCPLTGL